ncbi:MAG: hypothetical protein DRH57_06135 [Candidatus Cloacimonadota bacterium]|nr:MAG: hypothetical protein DRH57_06135 [Candidatus Cloacimonadota bacterium]
MKRIALFTILVFIGMVNYHSLFAVYFGKNKIQTQDIKWSVIETTHFDIYFENELDEVAQRATYIAEEAYYRLKTDFRKPIQNIIPIIIYNSHNKFIRTNVIFQLLSEGVSGFTESIKNRVVVPFDGSYRKFEETLTHELTHIYVNNIMSKGEMGNFFNSIAMRMPFWLSEGIPEFMSVAHHNYNDMFIQDMIINDKLVPLKDISGYYAYREGESFLHFLEDTFGRDSVMEFIYNFKMFRNIDNTTEKTFGMSIEELQAKWNLYLKRKYWNLLKDKDPPDEKAERLTNHKKDDSYINISPKFSPDGKDIYFFSNKSLYMDIYKMSSIGLYPTKRILRSGTKGELESFNFLKNNISVFKDGKKIAFIGKSDKGDYVFIYNTKTKQKEKIYLDFDAIYELDISPDGKKLVLVGQKDAKNDLYLYDLKNKAITRLTNDIYDDRYPQWSPDGKFIAFASERITKKTRRQDDKMTRRQDNKKTRNQEDKSSRGQDNKKVRRNIFAELYYNIFVYELDTDQIWTVTDEKYTHQYPTWSNDGKYLIFTSYKDSVANIYAYSIEDTSIAKITNYLGGTFSPDLSSDNNYLVFSSFYKDGWDIYLLSNPLENLEFQPYKNMQLTKYIPADSVFHISDYRRYYRQKREFRKRYYPERQNALVLDFKKNIDKQDSLNEQYNQEIDNRPALRKDKKPKIKKYSLKFSPDIIYGGMAYSSQYGFFGMLQLAFSDMLGNHHIHIMSNLTQKISKSDIMIDYFYLEKRLNYGIGIFNLHDYYYYLLRSSLSNEKFYQRDIEQNTGIHGLVSCPIDKFNRFDFYATFRIRTIKTEIWDEDWEVIDTDKERAYIFSPSINYVHDTALWGITGPIKGSRCLLSLEKSLSKDLDYLTFYGDIRRYLYFGKEYGMAFRLACGKSIGHNKQYFGLGGINSVRGYDARDFEGHNLALTNIEIRFPFVDQLVVKFPLPIELYKMRGAIFCDIGSVWNNTKLYQAMQNDKLKELKLGYGFGPRLNIGYFILKLDWAWHTDLSKISKPYLYFSLEAEF